MILPDKPTRAVAHRRCTWPTSLVPNDPPTYPTRTTPSPLTTPTPCSPDPSEPKAASKHDGGCWVSLGDHRRGLASRRRSGVSSNAVEHHDLKPPPLPITDASDHPLIRSSSSVPAPAWLTAAYGWPTRPDHTILGGRRLVRWHQPHRGSATAGASNIGGHRFFFTKVPESNALLARILSDDYFLMRPRTRHLLYDGKYFDYPLLDLQRAQQPGSVRRSMRGRATPGPYPPHPRIRPTNREAVAAPSAVCLVPAPSSRPNTEKVWGVPVSHPCPADWGRATVQNFVHERGDQTPSCPAKPEGNHLAHRGVPVSEVRARGMMWAGCRDHDVAAAPPSVDARRRGARRRHRARRWRRHGRRQLNPRCRPSIRLA